MQRNVMLSVASLCSVLFMSLHHADDVVRGMAPGNLSNLVPVVFLAIGLYGITLVLDERRAGYVIVLVLSVLMSGIPVVHMVESGLAGGDIAKSNGAFFFVWTLIALGVTALFSVILSALALRSLRRGGGPEAR